MITSPAACGGSTSSSALEGSQRRERLPGRRGGRVVISPGGLATGRRPRGGGTTGRSSSALEGSQHLREPGADGVDSRRHQPWRARNTEGRRPAERQRAAVVISPGGLATRVPPRWRGRHERVVISPGGLATCTAPTCHPPRPGRHQPWRARNGVLASGAVRAGESSSALEGSQRRTELSHDLVELVSSSALEGSQLRRADNVAAGQEVVISPGGLATGTGHGTGSGTGVVVISPGGLATRSSLSGVRG